MSLSVKGTHDNIWSGKAALQDVRIPMLIRCDTRYRQGYPCSRYRIHNLGVGEHFACRSRLGGKLRTVISFRRFVLGRVRDL